MKLLRLFIASGLLVFAISTQAQLSPSWTAEYSGVLNFQTVTATGTYLVSTSNSLSAYDMDNGNLIWSNNEITGISEDQLEEVSGSSLILIRQGSEVKILDPFDGTVKFNSTSAGFSVVEFEQMMYQANGILVSGKKNDSQSMVMVDLGTGDIRWEIDEKFGRIITAREFSESEMLVVALFNTYRISSDDGSIVWKVASSAEAARMQDAGALGALFQGVAEEMSKDHEFVIEYYEQPDRGIFIIAAEEANEVTAAGSSEETRIEYKNSYTAFRSDDGSRIWDNTVTMDGKLGDLAFYKNGAIIMPDDGSKTTINYYTFSSNEGQWGKKGRGIKIKGGVYDHIDTGKGLLLMAGTYDNTYLSFLDPATGMLTYDKPVKVSGRIMQTFESSKGIGFVTTEEFNILNTATGELVISKSINTHPGLVKLTDNTLYIFDTKGLLLNKVDLGTAEVSELTSDKLKFNGKEDPEALEIRDNGILLTSQQNIALFSRDGNLQFHKFYEAPGESGLKKALLVAQAVRAAYIGANAYVAAGTLQAAAPQVAQEDAVSGALVQGVGTMYEDLGNAASDFAKESLQRATARFKATAETRDYMIMLSKVDKDNKLLKVNKNTGEVDASIDLGKEKEPKYAVDEVTGKIFNQTGENQIACYNL